MNIEPPEEIHLTSIAVMTGAAGAGKTTIANHLVQYHDFARIRFAGTLKFMAAALGLSSDEIDGHLKETPSAKLTFENASTVIEKMQGALHAFGYDEDAIPQGGDEYTPLEIFNGKSLAFAAASLVHVILLCISKGSDVGATPRSLMQMIGTEWGRNMVDTDVWIKAWQRGVASVREGVDIVVDDCRFPNEVEACAKAGLATFFHVERDVATKLAGAVEQGHESEKHALGYHFIVKNNADPEGAGERVNLLMGWVKEHGNPHLLGLPVAEAA